MDSLWRDACTGARAFQASTLLLFFTAKIRVSAANQIGNCFIGPSTKATDEGLLLGSSSILRLGHGQRQPGARALEKRGCRYSRLVEGIPFDSAVTGLNLA